MKKRGIVAVVGVLLVAGCAASPDADTTAPAGATSAPSEAVDAGATTAQWASEVAQLKSSYDDLQSSWDDAICSALAVPDAPDCAATMTAMYYTAETAQTVLDGLQNQSGPAYLGDPPSEISGLVQETTEVARAAATSGASIACPGDQCLSTAFAFEQAWDELGSQYAAWSPYL